MAQSVTPRVQPEWVSQDGVDGYHGTDATIGPDLVVLYVQDIRNYGGELDLDSGKWIQAFGVGTTSCNRGDTPAIWVPGTNQHPVRARNIYRLYDGRFEQIGISWLEHGFFAVRGNACGECVDPGGVTGQHLGVNCSTPTSAGINGSQDNLGPRSVVNAFTGQFSFPFNRLHKEDKIDRRLQVFADDLDPELNSGALYFAEGHYVTPDDAAAGNHFNNASYRPVAVDQPNAGNNFCFIQSPDLDRDFCLFPTSITREAEPAIHAWKENDPDVVETEVRIPGEGMFILAAKATRIAHGYWQYEYALYNMNSDRSAAGFVVPMTKGTVAHDYGFHAPFYHSGEPYDNAPWAAKRRGGRVAWQTTPFEQNQDANALRWGTLYNFRFKSKAPPDVTTVEIELFHPGEPHSVFAESIGPELRRTPTRRTERG